MKLDKLKVYMQSLKEDMNDSAFTLIELIVVMAILAILVLLAAPQFLGYTDKAKVANIQNDTAVVEKDVNEGFILDDEDYDITDWDTADSSTLKDAFDQEKLYGKGGLLEEFDPTVSYSIVPRDVVDGVKSKLAGTFLTDKDGNVIYLDEDALSISDDDLSSELEDLFNMLLTDVSIIYDWELANMDDLVNDASKGLVYDKNGEVSTINPNTDYYVVPSDKAPSNREGTYYANEDGDVIYVYPSGSKSNIPGSNTLIDSDSNGNGIYDAIPDDGFFLNTVLPFPSTVKNRVPATWMKLEYDGRTMFVPQKPIGTVQSPSSNDPIYTPTNFSHDGITYRVRLFTESEWNNIMYPIHEDADSLGRGKFAHGLGTGNSKQFSNQDLALTGNGTWIQGGTIRGANGDVTYTSTSGNSGVYRPVVEAIGVDDSYSGGGSIVIEDTTEHEGRNYGGYGEEDIAWVNEMYKLDYVMAEDGDFKLPDKSWENGWRYTGDKNKIIIPMYIKGELVTSHEKMFKDLSGFDKLSVASNNPNVESTRDMFYNSSMTELVLSELDTSNVTDMYGMFQSSGVTELDLSGLDTSNVTDMSQMFYGSSATELDLSGLDTSNVTRMFSMFGNSSATKLNLRGLDTSNVINMYGMFSESSVTELDLSGLDTSKVSNMNSMFYNTPNLKTLDLSGFDIRNGALMSSMFRESAVETVTVSTQEIADILSTTSNIPKNIVFKVINN